MPKNELVNDAQFVNIDPAPVEITNRSGTQRQNLPDS